MRKNGLITLGCALLMGTVSACAGSGQSKGTTKNETAVEAVEVPVFDADSAYKYVAEQVDFGPRVPNTKAHVACGNYLAARLESFGAKVVSQYADLAAYDGTLLKSRNIIGSYLPESKKRIALFAHWDTRPWADSDADPKNHRKPVLGANDGASGVGTLLEIARQLQQKQPRLGVDIIFLDSEDYGCRNGVDESSWCLGAQYWARQPHVSGYNARFGILLDMVGGQKTVFMKEGYSEQYASDVNKKVWKAARKLGYGDYFVEGEGGFVTDDHLFINQLARIKTIDIIGSDPNGGFASTWHTVYDDMNHIDKSALKAVGQTVLEVIYQEK